MAYQLPSCSRLLMLLLWRIINNNNTTRHCLFDSFAVSQLAQLLVRILQFPPRALCLLRLALICCRADFYFHVLFICCTRITPPCSSIPLSRFPTPITQQLHFHWPQNVGPQVMECCRYKIASLSDIEKHYSANFCQAKNRQKKKTPKAVKMFYKGSDPSIQFHAGSSIKQHQS